MKPNTINIPRAILDDPDYLGERFSRPMAWIDLVLLSDENGEVRASYSRLASRWKWSVNRVKRYIGELMGNGTIISFHGKFHGKNTESIIAVNSNSYKGDGKNAEHSVERIKEEPPSIVPNGSPSHSPSFTPLLFPQENEKDEDIEISSQKEFINYQSILKMWNGAATRSVPKVQALSESRKNKIKFRVREMGGWEKARTILLTCFKKLNESEFCNGAMGKWVATFDWFFANEQNWMRVLEGNYDNRKEKSQLEKLAETYKKGHEYYEQRYGYGGTSPYGDPQGGGFDGPDEQ